MCGIFGMISKNGTPPNMELIRQATSRLAHRGPDGEGYFSEGPVAFGHRRLAIIDLTDAAAQPMSRQGCTIIHNGEIYNYLELRKELEAAKFQFTTHSDTEVILAAYNYWGTDCLSRFKGMWAFAIYDSARQKVFCARDRFGMKPFFYYQTPDYFYFASEIKAFTSLPGWRARPDTSSVYDFLVLGQQHRGAETLFEGVAQLEPGQWLSYDLNRHTHQIETYYDVNTLDTRFEGSFEAAAERFGFLLDQSVLMHQRADVSCGIALSGGLDSSSLLGVMCRQQKPGPSPTLTAISYCADHPTFNECHYVEQLEQQFDFRSVKITPSFEDLTDRVVEAQDEPPLSSSLLAQYAVFQAAKDHGIKVMLDGQGGDELLAGYPTYYRPWLLDIGFDKPSQLLMALRQLWQDPPISRQKAWYKLTADKDFGRFVKIPSPQEKESDSTPFNRFGRYSRAMIRSHNLPALLHFEDRNSMAHGVEARLPYLDHELLEFCLSLPAEYKIRSGFRKAVLRISMSEILPNPIAWRKDKLGFKAPEEMWIRQQREAFLPAIQRTTDHFPDIFERNLAGWAAEVLERNQQYYFPLLWRIWAFGRWGEKM